MGFYNQRITILLLVLTGFCAQPVWAQDEDEGQKTLSEILTINHSGFYGATTLKFSSIKSNFAFLMGGYGGWYVNKHLLIGGGGFGLIGNNIAVENNDKVVPDNQVPENVFLSYDLSYGGFMLEYTLNSDQLVHSSFNILVGGGTVEQKPEKGSSLAKSSVFVLEPTAYAEVNVVRFIRMGVGLGWRMVTGSHTRGITNGELSNLCGNFTIKLGYFD